MAFNIVPLAAQQRDISVLRPVIYIGTGFFFESLNWSIAGTAEGKNPNILSELKWTRQEGPLVEFGVHIGLRQFFAEGGCYYGRIYNGKVSDSDFSKDDRDERVFYTVLPTKKGFSSITSLGLGYSCGSTAKTQVRISAGPMKRTSRLFLSDPGSNLNSSYAPNFTGWYFKTKVVKRLSKVYSFDLSIAYNQLHYKAKANWNLIEEFEHPVSFKHKAKGFGLNCEPSLKTRLGSKTILSFGAAAWFTQTGRGTDQLFLANGKTSITQLNEVKQGGIIVKTGVNYNF